MVPLLRFCLRAARSAPYASGHTILFRVRFITLRGNHPTVRKQRRLPTTFHVTSVRFIFDSLRASVAVQSCCLHPSPVFRRRLWPRVCLAVAVLATPFNVAAPAGSGAAPSARMRIPTRRRRPSRPFPAWPRARRAALLFGGAEPCPCIAQPMRL